MYSKTQLEKLKRSPVNKELDRKQLISLFWGTVKNRTVGPHPYTTALLTVLDYLEREGRLK